MNDPNNLLFPLFKEVENKDEAANNSECSREHHGLVLGTKIHTAGSIINNSILGQFSGPTVVKRTSSTNRSLVTNLGAAGTLRTLMIP